MKSENYLSLDFYQNLGKLFYAIASADGHVHEAELITIKEMVKKDWLSFTYTKDHPTNDEVHQIIVTFDRLHSAGNSNGNLLFNDFVTFKNTQSHLFTKKIKELILKTAIHISESFSGKNKSELMLLAKLNIELNKV